MDGFTEEQEVVEQEMDREQAPAAKQVDVPASDGLSALAETFIDRFASLREQKDRDVAAVALEVAAKPASDSTAGAAPAGESAPATKAARTSTGVNTTSTTKKRERAAKGKKPAADPRGTSKFRGVTKHRHTARFESHLWDNASARMPSANGKGRKRGRQIYLGGFETEEQAAVAFDLAAIAYWGDGAQLNFPRSNYDDEVKEIQRENLTKDEVVAALRRKSSGFARGASKFRGVTRHQQAGRWEARIGRVMGNRYLYLGTYDSEADAAHAYDAAAIRYRGPRAVTNWDRAHYEEGGKFAHWRDLMPEKEVRPARQKQAKGSGGRASRSSAKRTRQEAVPEPEAADVAEQLDPTLVPPADELHSMLDGVAEHLFLLSDIDEDAADLFTDMDLELNDPTWGPASGF